MKSLLLRHQSIGWCDQLIKAWQSHVFASGGIVGRHYSANDPVFITHLSGMPASAAVLAALMRKVCVL